MPKKEAPLEYLDHYLPAGASEKILGYLHRFQVHLTITKTRRSILGDYRHATGRDNHRISVNGGLNKYAFLITLIHEIAHLITFQQYGNNVNSHGKEWKQAYRAVLEDFMRPTLFPADVHQTLLKSLHDLPASSCSDVHLTRVLKNYDIKNKMVLVEDIGEGVQFRTSEGRVFKRGRKIRKRIECVELQSGKRFLFSPVYEVEPC
jgi:SprT protein